MDVALATCAPLPEGDPDDAPLSEAFARAGMATTWAVWDDDGVDWSAFDAVVLRSTWDYQRRRDAFVAWVRSLPLCVNPPDVVEWNTDKRYLAELGAAGLPVVPTSFVEPGASLDGVPSGAFVVKPSVSAGSKDTGRFGPDDVASARALADEITAGGRVAMVQPYVASVDEHGETAVVCIDGSPSHAIRKGPILVEGAAPAEGLFAEEDIRPREATPDELEVAGRCLDFVAHRFGGPLAYARVDLVRDDDGAPQLLELELCEPSLFFAARIEAADELARAVAARLPPRTARS